MSPQDPPEPFEIGRRIVIWGVTGSGKTTLARHLGNALRLPVMELDTLRHWNGWNWDDDYSDMLQAFNCWLAAHPEGWVVDGSYSAISNTYLSAVDTVIWLHLPWRTSFRRVFKRTVGRILTRERVYHADGPRESVRQTLFSRGSILWWSISHHGIAARRARGRIATLPPTVRVYELRSDAEIATLLADVKKSAAEGALRSSQD